MGFADHSAGARAAFVKAWYTPVDAVDDVARQRGGDDGTPHEDKPVKAVAKRIEWRGKRRDRRQEHPRGRVTAS